MFLSQRKRSIVVHIPPRNFNILNDPYQAQTPKFNKPQNTTNFSERLASNSCWKEKKTRNIKLLILLKIHENFCTRVFLHINNTSLNM